MVNKPDDGVMVSRSRKSRMHVNNRYWRVLLDDTGKRLSSVSFAIVSKWSIV